MPSLEGLSVVVVGASGGLGTPISRRLAMQGARLTLVGRDRQRLESIDASAEIVVADLREPAQAERVRNAALAAYGAIDGLVVASGVVAFGAVADLTDDVLTDVFVVNALAPIRLVGTLVPALTESAQAGRSPFVVNLSAVVAEQPTAGMAAYSASKAALTAFDAAAGRELRRIGIRLVDARPPHTETGLATRPIAGEAPRLPKGLDPDAVAARVVHALLEDERDLPSASFG